MGRKEQTRLRVQRYRDRQKSVTNVTASVTEGRGDVTQKEVPTTNTNPAILEALVDPIKREKLEEIYQSLNEFKVADKIFYGYPGLGGVPFDVVGDYLEATN